MFGSSQPKSRTRELVTLELNSVLRGFPFGSQQTLAHKHPLLWTFAVIIPWLMQYIPKFVAENCKFCFTCSQCWVVVLWSWACLTSSAACSTVNHRMKSCSGQWHKDVRWITYSYSREEGTQSRPLEISCQSKSSTFAIYTVLCCLRVEWRTVCRSMILFYRAFVCFNKM